MKSSPEGIGEKIMLQNQGTRPESLKNQAHYKIKGCFWYQILWFWYDFKMFALN